MATAQELSITPARLSPAGGAGAKGDDDDDYLSSNNLPKRNGDDLSGPQVLLDGRPNQLHPAVGRDPKAPRDSLLWMVYWDLGRDERWEERWLLPLSSK